MTPLLLTLLLASPEVTTRRSESLAGRDWHAVFVALSAQTKPRVEPFRYLPINDCTDLLCTYGWTLDWEAPGYFYIGNSLTDWYIRRSGGFPEVLRLVPGVLVR